LNGAAYTDILSATTSTYSEIPSSVGTWTYRVNSSGCPTQYSTAATVVVAVPCTNPSISSQSTATQTQCLNSTFTAISVTAAGTGLSYQWYKNSAASTSGGTTVGTNSNSYTPLATTAGTLYYYCIVTGTCGSPVTSSLSGAFIVNPVSVGGSLTGGTNPIIYDSSTGTITLSGSTGSIVKWQKMVGASSWSDIANTNATYSENPTSAGTWQYRANVKSGVCTDAYSNAFSIGRSSIQ